MINRPRGTQDIYGDRVKYYDFVFNNFTKVAQLFGYQKIVTPMFENIETFIRSVGETSDIVKKEFYNFKDKSDREIALRPEGTAGVVRAVIEDKLIYTNSTPLKFYYYGPMFRYERPQSGRLREFNQFGIELIKSDSIYDDFDIIQFVVNSLKSVGISEHTIKINNLGGFEERSKWIEAIKAYLTPYKQELSELSQERLNKNPLRILDDKIDGIKDFVKQSPKIADYLSNESKNQFTQLLDLLKENKINFMIDETLVRGLDYYTNMVFEIEVNGMVVGGGGRYGKLVGEFGGDDVSCVGMAFGIERVIDVLEKQNIKFSINIPKSILFFPLKKEANPAIIKYMQYYRDNGIICTCNYGINKLAKAFNFAEKNNYEYVAIIGENELKDQTITIKNIKTAVQETINYQKFIK